MFPGTCNALALCRRTAGRIADEKTRRRASRIDQTSLNAFEFYAYLQTG